MFSQIYAASTVGINAFLVEIETHVERAMFAVSIVGLPDNAVRESRERVGAAVKNSGLEIPLRKYTVNLAPADIRKEGSAFDLPIALGMLAATDQIPSEHLKGTVVLGELALDGTLRPGRGVLPIALTARREGLRRIILPHENAEEAALVGELEVLPAGSLREVISHLQGRTTIPRYVVDREELFRRNSEERFDMADVRGQENVKRAVEVAAAGGHNVIMVGPPGGGKTMIAKRIPSLLPPLCFEEALETTKLHSVAGTLPDHHALVTARPFRSPHHTISDAALVGGGIGFIRPGEISLAHHGVLFLDELPEFARNVLEVLRQPLEDREITISRTRMSVTFPCNFMMVASMNPCPCGNFGNPNAECHCSPVQIQRYMSRISGPLLDRIDIHIEVPAVNYRDLSSRTVSEGSAPIRERVVRARMVQTERYRGRPEIFKNADMASKDIREHSQLDVAGRELLKTAMTRIGLSARAYDKILKVARTIADLAGEESIRPEHLSEAIQYRSLDRRFWNV